MRIRRNALAMIGLATLAACGGQGSHDMTDVPSDSANFARAAAAKPGTVTNLSATATSASAVTLSFTQVNNGAGGAASYDVRFAKAPMQWGGPSVTNGTCSTPLAGTGTSGTLTCTVLGLTENTKYGFQLVAYRGTLNTSSAVFGSLSNVAEATTPPATSTPVVTSVTLAPTSASIAVGATRAFTATVRDQNGAVMSCSTALTWSTQNTAVATVNASGTATGQSAGSTTVKAACGSVSGMANITVTSAAPVATSVTVAPASASIAVGATQNFTATVRDQNGVVMTCSSLGWSSLNTAVATVNASGTATGQSAGSATIRATCASATGNATLTVTASPPPPPPGGGDTIFFENWEANNFNKWQDGYKPATQKINTDANAFQGSRYLDVTYASGSDGGWLTTFFMPGYDSLYVRAYVKLSSNWTGGTKFLAFMGSRTDNMWSAFGTAGKCPTGTDFFTATVVTEPTGGTSTMTPPIRMYSYFPGMQRDANGNCWGNYGNGSETYYSPLQMSFGTWHKIEFWVRINTPGQSNGAQRVWIDGRLLGDWPNAVFRTSTILKLNSLQLSFSSITPPSGTQHLFVDDILVLGKKASP